MRTELHCHTTASDGLCAPAEVVRLARLRDVALLAITDHDTIAGNDEAAAAGDAQGVRVIRGIEVSALSRQGETHVLGYGVQPNDAATRARIAALRGVRESRARGILDKLTRFGIHIPFEQVKALAGDAMIGRPHVARALVMVGAVHTEQEAFDLYLAEGKPAFVPHEGLTPAQAVQLIHDAGGLAVLAHPGFYAGDLSALLDEMIPAGLDGIEVFYPLHTPEQTAHFAELARRHGLLLTGGSDFHGPRGDAELALGSVHVPPEHVEALLVRLEE
ncbi:MAG: PHP domain-containing protein [Anaerolineae bacterium]|nr:PHP domain-containing protein [Candidatus Roseilinea sp.]MDW8451246.1 PHP domain-containing protein [Anaerolineae bacterium]